MTAVADGRHFVGTMFTGKLDVVELAALAVARALRRVGSAYHQQSCSKASAGLAVAKAG